MNRALRESIREHRRLAALANRLLDAEILKPLGTRDETFINECEETILYCERTLAELKRERASLRPRSKRALARAAIIFAAALLLIASAATVAQASGVRVWSAIVHWDPAYLDINYSASGKDDPPNGAERTQSPNADVNTVEVEELLIDTADALRESFGSALLYPYGADEPEFVSASAEMAEGKAYAANIHTRFRGHEVDIRILLGDEETSPENVAVRLLQYGGYAPVSMRNICGTECALAGIDGHGMLAFPYGNDVYFLKGEVPLDVLAELAALMLGEE